MGQGAVRERKAPRVNSRLLAHAVWWIRPSLNKRNDRFVGKKTSASIH